MKKVLKVLIPLVLILALLISACWYFLFYNRPLTVEFLMDQSSTMVSSKRYERAILYNKWAWNLMPEWTDLALELSDTYVATGNYTKAEYTLVSAISSNPSQAGLYEALCRIYVEQNKLLDAVQMLDRITDAHVIEYMNTARPAAPILTPESGYYTEYIEVSAQSDAPYVYITTDGKYPSNNSDLYSEPLIMQAGETTLITLAVNDQGLVSPAAVFGYTVGGVVEAVELADPAIDSAVREILGYTAADTIMSDDLWTIQTLELSDTVSNLSDLSRFTGLTSLTIQNVSGLEISVFHQVPTLQTLDLSGCTISTQSMTAISSLTNLTTLRLESCALTDISALSTLTKLEELDLSGNFISDISVIALMPNMSTIDLANNPLESIAGLSNCRQLEYVDIRDCGIQSIEPLSKKSNMLHLMASNNQISDLSPLVGCRSMETLLVSNNLISDITVLKSMPKLVTFEANYNGITGIPNIRNSAAALVSFIANYNDIEDISGLSGIDSLNYVELDYNQVTDISPLAENYNLIQLDIWDNPIPEVSEAVKPFEESSIIVNFNPNYEVPEETEEDNKE